MRLRRKVYRIMEMHDGDSKLSLAVNWFIMVLILVNVFGVILETVDELHARWHDWFLYLEVFSVAVFTLEYLTRLWVCVESHLFSDGWRGRLRYAMTPMALIDLLAIMPFFLQMFIALDTRILRVFRLLRVFKLTRHFTMLGVLGVVLKREAKTLASAIFILLVLAILAASGIYLAEHKVQPEAFGNIPKAMWWAIVTLTTVGYGDVVPQTDVGRMFGAFITMIGVGMAALPAGIIASGFTGEVERRRERYETLARSLLRDGVLDDKDRKALIKAREEWGIDRSDAQQIIRKAIVDAEMLHESTAVCPHCGKPIGDLGKRHITTK